MEERLTNTDTRPADVGGRSIVAIFRRRIWTLIPVAGLVVMIAAMYSMVQPRLYEASAWMLITGGGKSKSELMTQADIWRTLQDDMSVHVRLIRRAEIAEQVRQQLELDIPHHAMVSNVDVVKVPGASANLISLSYRSTDPNQAQAIINAWSAAYERDSRERATLSTASAIDYVQDQIETVEQELKAMEEEMAELEQDYLDVGLTLGAQGAGRVISTLDQISQSRVEMQAIQAQIDRTLQRLEGEPREIEEVQEEPTHRARAIEQQLSQLNVEMQRKLQDYYEDSPEVESLRQQIGRLEQQLEDQEKMTRSAVTTIPNPVYMNAQDALIELYGTLDGVRARQTALQGGLAEERRLAGMVPEGAIHYNELMRKVKGLQEVHSSLLSRLYDLQLQRAMVVSPVQVVREAELPRSLVSPQYQTIILMGLIGAILLAALAAVVVDQIDDTFADPAEIRELLGERLVGVLPQIDENDGFGLQFGADNGGDHTAFANAVRMLASTIRIEMSRSENRSLTVVSSGRAEGKTLIAANLAAALAGAGERVLVIDADLHRPRLHQVFDLSKDPGLTNVLMGDVEMEDMIQPTQISNLRVLTAGPLPPSPLDLLASSHGQSVIRQLSELADYVIWDTPPAGFLPDATVIAHGTDRTLFVVGRQARRSAARMTIENLREIGVDVIGLTANCVQPAGGSYYYYYYHDYYHDAERDQPEH